jgi:hypothetical protein
VNITSVEYFILDHRMQQQGESVAKYAEALHHLARSCKFASAEQMLSYLTIVFPRNLRDVKIKEILIPEGLSFEDAVKKAKALECTVRSDEFFICWFLMGNTYKAMAWVAFLLITSFFQLYFSRLSPAHA